MTFQIIIQVVLLGIALAMDAFAVSITDGLIYQDINKRKSFFIAGMFGLMQGIMPLIGYWLVELMGIIVDQSTGAKAGDVLSIIVAWLAFALLILIGSHMIYEAIKELRKPVEEKSPKLFSYKEVFLFSIATSIDALATGVALHAGMSSNTTIFFHVLIIASITFVICLIGLFLGKQIEKLFKGKHELTSIVGGIILIFLAVYIIISHYVGL